MDKWEHSSLLDGFTCRSFIFIVFPAFFFLVFSTTFNFTQETFTLSATLTIVQPNGLGHFDASRGWLFDALEKSIRKRIHCNKYKLNCINYSYKSNHYILTFADDNFTIMI